jgi:type I restriction enzyme S subunit
VLRISAATSRPDGVVDQSDIRWLTREPESYAAWFIEPDDLLACRFNGNPALVGRFARVVEKPHRPLVYPDKLIRFRVEPAVAVAEFVRVAMNHGTTRQRVETLCATTAGNVGLSARRLADVRFQLPEVAAQRRLVTEVASLRAKQSGVASQSVEQVIGLRTVLSQALVAAVGRPSG